MSAPTNDDPANELDQRPYFDSTPHARERFRERVGKKYARLSEDDLRDLLNDHIWYRAILVRTVTDPRVRHVPTTLYLFARPDGHEYVAIVRRHMVVTILDGWMVDNNFPGWRFEPGEQAQEGGHAA